jgi:small subunit ribosomal protein S5
MKAVNRIPGGLPKIDASELSLNEKLVSLTRVVKVVKGGKNLHFRALVVVGDGNGHVGAGLGKAREVPDAIRKAGVEAKKNIIKVNVQGTTVAHDITARFGAAKVLLKPAAPGTGVIAGGGVRAVIEAAGVRNILSKSLGSSNSINVVKATMIALANIKSPQEAIAFRKGTTVKQGAAANG